MTIIIEAIDILDYPSLGVNAICNLNISRNSTVQGLSMLPQRLENFTDFVSPVAEVLLSPFSALKRHLGYVACTLDFSCTWAILHSTVYLGCLLTLILLVLSVGRIIPRRGTQNIPAQPLKALLAVITPTCSLWPDTYISLARMMKSSKSKTHIEIPTAKLVQDIFEGRIELRNPQQDLPNLLLGVLESRGWKVCLRVEASLWFRTALWIFPYHMALSYGRIPIGVSGSDPLGTSSAESTDLDTVPYTSLQPYIQHIQRSLAPDVSAHLIFTTRDLSIPFLSSPFVLTMLPFLPSSQTRHTLAQPGRIDPSSIALHISMHQIVELLGSGPHPLTILSVINVSDEYSRGLYADARAFEPSTFERSHGSEEYNETWRRAKLMKEWEAALLEMGQLTRWVIEVRRNAAARR